MTQQLNALFDKISVGAQIELGPLLQFDPEPVVLLVKQHNAERSFAVFEAWYHQIFLAELYLHRDANGALKWSSADVPDKPSGFFPSQNCRIRCAVSEMDTKAAYAIADAMQIDVKIRSFDITSKRVLKCPFEKVGLRLKLTVEAIGGYASATGDDIGVLYHVRGNLFLLVSAEPKIKGTVTEVAILNAKHTKAPKSMYKVFTDFSKIDTIKAAASTLDPCAAQVYRLSEGSVLWQAITPAGKVKEDDADADDLGTHGQA